MKLQSGIYLIIAMVATAAIMHDEGLSKLATRAPFGMMDFYLANMRTLCARAVAEEEWTCTLTCEDLWRDPNWSNNTAPECKKTYKWDGERADFAEKLSMCWRDTDNPRNLPAFQHSIKSFTTPGNFTLSLVDHVVDQELSPPWDVRGCYSYPAIHLPLISQGNFEIEYRRNDVVQAVITGMTG